MVDDYFTFILFLITNSIYNCKLTMETEQSVMLVVLSRLIDSDNEKSTSRKNRSWMKRRSVGRYFNNVIRELMIEDRVWVQRNVSDESRGLWIYFKIYRYNSFPQEVILCILCIWWRHRWLNVGWKRLLNQSNMKTMLDEAIKCYMKVCSEVNFHPTYFLSSNMIFSFFVDFERV